jgi:hypothetical protein
MLCTSKVSTVYTKKLGNIVNPLSVRDVMELYWRTKPRGKSTLMLLVPSDQPPSKTATHRNEIDINADLGPSPRRSFRLFAQQDAHGTAQGQTDRQMVENYARQVNQIKLAASAILKWEVSGNGGMAGERNL